MRSSLLALAAVPALGQILDIPDDNRMVQEEGLLRFPLKVSKGAPAVKNLTKRQNDVGLTSQQTGFFYSIDLSLGTPGQSISVNFDTGSSELWVNPVCSKSNDPEFCESFGRFGASSTFVDLNTAGGVTYGSGYVDFEYGYDFVSVGPAKISQQIFGVATDSEFASVGIMGAGPDLSGWDSPYPFVIDNLASQGFINSRAFALDIRSLDSERGSVVFGGIDTKKYTGPLEKRPIIDAANSPDGYTRYWIYLDGITVTQDDGTESPIFSEVNGQPVLLDSGYTISALPGPIFEKLVAAFPSAKPYPGSDMYEVDCSTSDLEGTVDFIFGETTINVPFNDFIWHQPEANLCLLGAFQDDEFPVLGDTFLRAAYVVYDWDNRNIHLANNQDCGSKLVAIGSGADAVPSLVGECGGASTTSTTAGPTSTETTAVSSTETEATTTEATTEASSTEVSTTEATSTEASTTEGETTTAETTTAETTAETTATEASTTEGESTTAEPTETETQASTFSTLSSSHYWNTTSAATTTTGGQGGSTTAPPTLTSTIITTSVHTITSCPPTVTNCPIGHVTTEVITSYTTYCPGNEVTTKAPKPTSLTSTYTTTKTYTVTDCPGEGPCHKGELTTAVFTSTKYVCPESTATFTIRKTITVEGKPKTTDCVVTIEPVPTKPVPQPIPGCTGCAPPPAQATTTIFKVFTPTAKRPGTEVPATNLPTDKIATVTKGYGCTGTNCPVETKTPVCEGEGCPTESSPAVVTAGAADFRASGFFAAAIGALVAAAL
ncbi:Fc.00g010050.m01.CDS01 [Cosmosporella sp. VM-42]